MLGSANFTAKDKRQPSLLVMTKRWSVVKHFVKRRARLGAIIIEAVYLPTAHEAMSCLSPSSAGNHLNCLSPLLHLRAVSGVVKEKQIK